VGFWRHVLRKNVFLRASLQKKLRVSMIWIDGLVGSNSSRRSSTALFTGTLVFHFWRKVGCLAAEPDLTAKSGDFSNT
jgi:hypothetical protein